MAERGYAHHDVQEEHERWISDIGPADPYLGQITIGIHEVLEAHFLLVDFFCKIGEGIGGVGPKDINLLHSALGRQFVEFGGKPKWKDRISVCATLMYGLIKNHPFYDTNKRTAFLTAMLHLQKIGRTPTAPQNEYEDLTVSIANNKLHNYKWYHDISGPILDREILTISRFLKRNTRQIDLRLKYITYSDLNTILGKRGFGLENPKGNRIDLVRYIDSDGHTKLVSPKRIAHVGFHGWSKQVSAKDIAVVRDASKLDARNGYDSQSFFNGAEDPLSLIRKYREPLERLAFR